MIKQTRDGLEFLLQLSVLTTRVKVRNQGKVSNHIVSLGNDTLEQLRVRRAGLEETDCG